MSKFVKLFLLICCLSIPIQASTIIGTINDAFGSPMGLAKVLFEPLSNPQYNQGILLTSPPKQVLTDTNGSFSINLSLGDYRVRIAGRDQFRIAVPNDTNTYSIQTVTTTALVYVAPLPPSVAIATPTTLGGVTILYPPGHAPDSVPTVYAVTNVDTLLAAKLDSTNGTAVNLAITGGSIRAITNLDLTANRVMVSGSDRTMTNGAVTTTELGYLSGVTGSIQTSLAAKLDATNGAAVNLGITGGSIRAITNLDLTASRVMVSGPDRTMTNGAVTATELGYLSGVIGGLQTNIDAHLPLNSLTNLGASKILRTDSNKNLAALSIGAGLAFDGSTLTNSLQTTPSNLVFVATTGSDTTGDGTSARPFQTIQHSINQISANNNNATLTYAIMVLPGVYNETLNFGFTNLYNLNVIGIGSPSTVSAVGINTTSGTTNFQSLLFRNIGFSGNVALTGDQTGGLAPWWNNLEFDNCVISGTCAITNAQLATFSHGTSLSGDVTCVNVISPVFIGAAHNPGATLTVKLDGTKPNEGLTSTVFIEDSIIGRFDLLGSTGGTPITMIIRRGSRVSTPAAAANTITTGGDLVVFSSVIRNGISNTGGTIENTGEYYLPAVSGNWIGTVPTRTDSALDNLAANTLKVGGNQTVNSSTVTNGITALDVGTLKLIRTDANSKLSPVTIGTGINFDGTTISGTGGTVTSVGLSAPSQFSISGSPVTSAGSLAISWNSASANTVLAGPSSGAASAPTIRTLVDADIPSAIARTNMFESTQFSVTSSPKVSILSGATMTNINLAGTTTFPSSTGIAQWAYNSNEHLNRVGASYNGAGYVFDNLVTDGGAGRYAVLVDGVEKFRVDAGSIMWLSSTANAAGLYYGQGNDTLELGKSHGATTDTKGYVYINSVAGIPTGVPAGANDTSKMAVVFDKSNTNLYFFGNRWIKLANAADLSANTLPAMNAAGNGLTNSPLSVSGSRVSLASSSAFALAGVSSSILRADSSGNITNAIIGSGLSFDGVTLSATGGGGGGSAPTNTITGNLTANVIPKGSNSTNLLDGPMTVASVTNVTLIGNFSPNAITATNGISPADIAASKLVRTDSSQKLAAVTIGSGLTFDGTTLAATGGGGGGSIPTNTITGNLTANVIPKGSNSTNLLDGPMTVASVTNVTLIGNFSPNAITSTNGISPADIAASKLVRTDSSQKLAAVTVGSGLAFDGTTLSASGNVDNVGIMNAATGGDQLLTVTYTAISPSITLTNAGTYLITGLVRVYAGTSPHAFQNVFGRLINATDGDNLNGALFEREVVLGSTIAEQLHLEAIYTISSGPKTINIQLTASNQDGGTPTAIVTQQGTTLSFVQLR